MHRKMLSGRIYSEIYHFDALCRGPPGICVWLDLSAIVVKESAQHGQHRASQSEDPKRQLVPGLPLCSVLWGDGSRKLGFVLGLMLLRRG